MSNGRNLMPLNRLHKPHPYEDTNNRQYKVEPLRIVKINQDGEKAMKSIPLKTTSPWSTYRGIYKFRLGDNDLVLVAEKKGISFDLVSICHFGALTDNQIKMLSTIDHPNFVAVHDIYKEENGYYLVFEHMPRSLQEAVGNPEIDCPKLAAIVGQVVTALAYLEREGLQHGHLTCSQIFLDHNGRVKLFGQEKCTLGNSKKDIEDLGYVMMELMEGYVKESDNIGLDKPDRWDPEVLSFLSATTSAHSASELLQHSFLRTWQRGRLKGLVSLMLTWTRQEYKYLGWQSKT